VSRLANARYIRKAIEAWSDRTLYFNGRGLMAPKRPSGRSWRRGAIDDRDHFDAGHDSRGKGTVILRTYG
jgi:hypothetical protein